MTMITLTNERYIRNDGKSDDKISNKHTDQHTPNKNATPVRDATFREYQTIESIMIMKNFAFYE